jgi:hypothetical protein
VLTSSAGEADAQANLTFDGTTLAVSTTVRAGDGSVINPSYSFLNDTAAGLYSMTTHVFGIASDGTTRMTFSNSAIGVATTTPRFGWIGNAQTEATPALDVAAQVYGRLPVSVYSASSIDLATAANYAAYANSYVYLTNSAFDTITMPNETSTTNGGTFFQFKNSTSSYLSVTLSPSLTVQSPVIIPPSSAITLVISPNDVDTFLLF